MKTSSVSKLLFLLGLLAGPRAASAQDLGVSVSTGNDLILTSPSCSQLVTQHQAICAFKKTTDVDFVVPVVTEELCQKQPTGQYQMTVSGCLPQFIKTNQSKKNYHSGANCWGTAMSFKQLSSVPRFVWSNEMSYWLESPLCRKLAPSEERLPGDLLSVYGPESIYKKDEASNKGFLFWEALFPGRFTPAPVAHGYSGYHHFLHSEIYLTPVLSFGKDSPSKLDRFEFNLLKEVYGRPRGPECQEDQARAPHLREYQKAPRPIKGSKCDYFSVVHRCENVETYFRESRLSSTDLQLYGSIKEFQKLQDKLFPLLMISGYALSTKESKALLRISDEAADQSLKELSQADLEKTHELLLVLKYFTASGIRKSLEHAKLTPPTEEL